MHNRAPHRTLKHLNRDRNCFLASWLFIIRSLVISPPFCLSCFNLILERSCILSSFNSLLSLNFSLGHVMAVSGLERLNEMAMEVGI